MGVVFLGSCRSMPTSLGGSRRLAVADSALTCASSSFRVGSAPCQRRYTTSSNEECSTRSLTS